MVETWALFDVKMIFQFQVYMDSQWDCRIFMTWGPSQYKDVILPV